MLNKEDIKALLEIFKSGSIENVELALQLAQNGTIDLYLPHFEELFTYLVKSNVFSSVPNFPIAEKIHQILSIESIKLQINSTELAIIPASIYLLNNLKQLTIGAEIEVYVPFTIAYFDKLEVLEIFLLDQKKFPMAVFEITSLKKLDLSLNLFTELPREVWQLRALEELNLINCIHLQTIPNELFGLPKLENVYLLQTLVDEISPSIAYSNIKRYVLELDEEGKKVIANPQIGTKLLKYIQGNSQWSQAFTSAIKSRAFTRTKVTNVPASIKKQGLEAIKEYFKGK